MKERLDKLLVERGLATTRERARALILAGKVNVGGQPAPKAGSRVEGDAQIEVERPGHPYVSRGGVKMEAALRTFGLVPTGWTAIDIGGSTGGFTDCLLRHGAGHVFAVDVGYGQLAWKLRNDPRVTVLERTNIRYLDPDTLGCSCDLAVMDVSFISLRLVLRHAVAFLKPKGHLLALVKPQFEAGRDQVKRGGRVIDPAVHESVLTQVGEVADGLGLSPLGSMPSPITGKKSGNPEYFMLWRLAQ